MTKNALIKISGSMLMLGGLLYMLIQLVHPADELASVTTSLYIAVAVMTSIMSILIFFGILGLYVNHSESMGVFGFVGFVIFDLFWLISMMFSFIEASVLPLLTQSATEFVVGMTGLFSSVAVSVDMGVFPMLAVFSGMMYVFGGLLFGISLYRSRVFSKKLALMLSVSAVLTLTTAIIPHPWDRTLAIPMGTSLLLIGYFVTAGKRNILRSEQR
jgi:hypothetical protein